MADWPAAIRSSMLAPIARSHGILSSSVSGSPRAILAMFASGCSRSPSVNGQPSRPASSAPTVDLPLPETPATITITAHGPGAAGPRPPGPAPVPAHGRSENGG